MIRIKGLALPPDYTRHDLLAAAAARLGIPLEELDTLEISSRSIDASDKSHVCCSIDLDVTVRIDEKALVWGLKDKKVRLAEPEIYRPVRAVSETRLAERPAVIGCGPAGMFAALILAEAGERPVLYERGMDVDARGESVRKFWETGVLDPESNVQFGAGGAGAFSDGKLKTGLKDARKRKILEEFVAAGAPPDILYDKMPHIGTDVLHTVVKNILAKIRSLGGEIHFGSRLVRILSDSGRMTGAGIETGTGFVTDRGRVTGAGIECRGTYTEIRTDHLILAIGHSARDTFGYLESAGIRLEAKPFAVGVRIEHPQSLIDRIHYGASAGRPGLGASPYKMVVHLPDGRAVYTFCMCPGGFVVAAASEAGRLVTNGMSERKRDRANANSAILVTVTEKDIGSGEPLAGIAFQRKIEEAAYAAGGGAFRAPVQRLGDFMANRRSTEFGSVLPSYMPGTAFARTDSYLPAEIAGALRGGFREMDEWMPGYFYEDALLTGAETRSTSPVRIPRGVSGEAESLRGLYPCGEGAGYSGGILSAAADGMISAEKILAGGQLPGIS